MLRSQLSLFSIFLTLGVVLSGCTVMLRPTSYECPLETAHDEIASKSAQAVVPVVRSGRYTLIEWVPEPSQRDLLSQIVEVSTPYTLATTVGDAMRHVLLDSGYRLCDSNDAAALYALPLPAAHLHLGLLTLRDALLTLAGPAWDLSVDEVERQLCFSRHTSVTAAPTDSPSADAVRSSEPFDEAQP